MPAESNKVTGPLAIFTAALVLLFIVIHHGSAVIPQPRHFEPGTLVIAPYLQLGRTGNLADMEVCWGTADSGNNWKLQSMTAPPAWNQPVVPKMDRVAIEGVEPFTICHAPLSGLITPSADMRYRIMNADKAVVEAPLTPLHNHLQPYRFAVVGDIANGSIGQRAVALRLYQTKPDIVLVAGDIVYQNGRLSEYFKRFFPVYNSDAVTTGSVPMLRSTLFVAAPGNHDTAKGTHHESSELNRFPDGLAYYQLWKQPLNGPDVAPTPGVNLPNVRGMPHQVRSFIAAAGESWPRMGSFSFNYGNAHFTVLDANLYMDWTSPLLRDWLEKDLQKSKLSQWHFVLFHQPPFNSDSHHYNEQQMRLVADIFQNNSVDIVFAGHVHNYQRTRPLRFKVTPQPDGSLIRGDAMVDGQATLDMQYDGKSKTKPNGVIYVVTGCGGATLTGQHEAGDKRDWGDYTVKFTPQHSVTQCDIKDNELTVQQVDTAGKVLDKFVVTK